MSKHEHEWIWKDDEGPTQVCRCGAERDVRDTSLILSRKLYAQLRQPVPANVRVER